jgi:hypothetical protein
MKTAVDIMALALSIMQGADVASVFVQIIGKAIQGYQAHTGKPLDPMLIKAEAPI